MKDDEPDCIDDDETGTRACFRGAWIQMEMYRALQGSSTPMAKSHLVSSRQP
jgi:hypothetical protein